MLRFFRNIRQKLLENGNLRKYFWYALGEILLVMIGILLALQVNNWNEQRKLAGLEHELLNEILSDLRVDSSRFSYTIDDLEEQVQTAGLLRNHMDKRLPYNDSLDAHFSSVSFPPFSEVVTAGYESLKNVGVITLTTDSLRENILLYYDVALFNTSVTNRYDLSNYFRERIYPKYFESFRWRYVGAKPSDYDALQESNEFKIALDYVINDMSYYKRQYETILSFNIKLMEDIRNELNK
ncbi:MAG: DUF6090 family protein [bacterium]|nr:DUF6090 family protein [bacterium]